jgi:UTP:GlnB (protein PII) uridylyltransferase
VLQDVVAGRVDVSTWLDGRARSMLHARSSRIGTVVHADNGTSSRYTIIDIVTGNALGLLYRISRVISQHGCDVDLVLIATEGERAIDVFHITKAGAKLTEAEHTALTADLVRTLEGTTV